MINLHVIKPTHHQEDRIIIASRIDSVVASSGAEMDQSRVVIFGLFLDDNKVILTSIKGLPLLAFVAGRLTIVRGGILQETTPFGCLIG